MDSLPLWKHSHPASAPLFGFICLSISLFPNGYSLLEPNATRLVIIKTGSMWCNVRVELIGPSTNYLVNEMQAVDSTTNRSCAEFEIGLIVANVFECFIRTRSLRNWTGIHEYSTMAFCEPSVRCRFQLIIKSSAKIQVELDFPLSDCQEIRTNWKGLTRIRLNLFPRGRKRGN